MHRVLLTTLLCIFLIACGGKKNNAAPVLAQPAGVIVSSGMEIGSFTQPVAYEQGIGIHARADGPSIVLSVDNQTEQPLDVFPFHVAVITGPNRQTDLVPLAFDTADLRGFRGQTIQPKENSVFRFTLREHPNPQGFRVVFRSPEHGIQFYTVVE